MCYPCPRTVLLPLSPDRTHRIPNTEVHLKLRRSPQVRIDVAARATAGVHHQVSVQVHESREVLLKPILQVTQRLSKENEPKARPKMKRLSGDHTNGPLGRLELFNRLRQRAIC